MMMARYWDLENKEKAELTEENVRDLCKTEMMEKGVIDPKAPILLDEKAPVPKTRIMYDVLRKGDYSYSGDQSVGAVFDSIEDAESFMNLLPKQEVHCGRTNTQYIKEFENLSVKPIEVADEQDVERFRIDLEKAVENKRINAEAKSEYQKQVKIVQDATSGVWEDWHLCRKEADELERIRGTYVEYMDMCGGITDTAKKFLLKAYNITDCRKALPDITFEEKEPSDDSKEENEF